MARWKPFPIIGGAYSDDCKPWSSQDTVNYIPVIAEKSGTRSREMLRCLPGYATFCDLGTGAPIRGARNVEGRLFVVSGQTLFSVSPAGASTALGTIPGVQRCSLSHNQITGGNEVAISNGQAGYVYNTATSTLAQITDDGFPGAICFDFVDGYITAIEPARRFAFISDIAAATSYNTLDQFEAEGSPDLLRGQAITHREWWLMGERTIEPFINTGDATGTFQRAQGTVIEVGLAATHAVAVMDNSVFWLGNDGIVYRANGYTPARISTHAIEQAIARCNMAQAFAFTFEDRGHKVFYLTFPDGQTWGFDAASGEWHRRQSYGLNRWRINTLTLWNGYWIAGDFSNGKLYVLDWNVQHEAGQILERRRITGAFHDSQNNVIVNALELVADTGLPQVEVTTSAVVSISGSIGPRETSQTVDFTYTTSATFRPVAVTLLSGTLPTGLSMDTTGRITGTINSGGTFSWVVRATDAKGNHADHADSVTPSAVFDPNVASTKFLLIDTSDNTDRSAIGYDDSAWPLGKMPLGTSNRSDAADYGLPTDVQTNWPLTNNCWFRGTFSLESIADIHLHIYLDDYAAVYINGAMVFEGTAVGTPPHYYYEQSISASALVVGSNVVAVKCRGDIYGVNNFVTFRLTNA